MDVQVLTSQGDEETVPLTETPAGSGMFVGTIGTALAVAESGDGVLQLSDQATISAVYLDQDDGSGEPAWVRDTVVAECQPMAIDIKPGSYPNSINLRSRGQIPVAILTTSTAQDGSADFDAILVDPETVLFADAAPVHSALEDVDGDGDRDLILHFRTQEVAIEPEDTAAKLTGLTYLKEEFFGLDSVRPISRNR